MTSRAAPVTISRRRLFFVMVALFTSMLLAALDQTIFGTALPTIVGELGGVDLMLWVATAYILASTLVMPLYGKLGDLIGHKVLLLSALGLFLVGSVLGGLAPNMTALIAARGIQGLGGGGLMILSQSVIADIMPPRRRGFYMGILIGAWSFASVLGPILGGWFADTIGWRWAFWFNLPLGVLAIIFVAAFLKTPAHKKTRPALDGWGMASIAVCATAIVLATSLGGTMYSWGSGLILGLIGLAVVAGVLFVLVERRAAEPILPLPPVPRPQLQPGHHRRPVLLRRLHRGGHLRAHLSADGHRHERDGVGDDPRAHVHRYPWRVDGLRGPGQSDRPVQVDARGGKPDHRDKPLPALHHDP